MAVGSRRPEFPHPLRKAVRNSIPRLSLSLCGHPTLARPPSHHGARSPAPPHPPCLSDIALDPPTGFRSPIDRSPSVRHSDERSGDTGELCVSGALSLPLPGRPLSPGARSGLRMPARTAWLPLPGASLRQQFLRDGRRPAAPPRTSSVPRQESARASERGGGKSKVGKGPQERNFRFNGQLRRRRHQQQRGRGEGGREGGERHSIPRVRSYASDR